MCPPSFHVCQPCRVVCMLVYMFVTTVTPYVYYYTTIPPPYICVCVYEAPSTGLYCPVVFPVSTPLIPTAW